MSWFAEEGWLVIAASGVVIWVVCRFYDPFHQKPKVSWNVVAWAAAHYAAITIPAFYLFNAFLKGLHGKGWMAGLFD